MELSPENICASVAETSGGALSSCLCVAKWLFEESQANMY